MTTSRPLRAALLGLACVPAAFAASTGIVQGAERKTILALYQALPALPSTAAEAARWVDKGGKVVHPGLIALRSDIAAHEKSMESVQLASAKQAQAQSTATMQSLEKGMADVGIDMQRMQSDPAYAQQMQEKLKSMSPAELMAMSQKMNQPLAADPRTYADVQATAADTPAVKAAADAGAAYTAAQQQRLQSHSSRWAESDRAAKQLQSKPLDAGARKPAMEYDNPGCDQACNAQWNAYADRMLPLLVQRDTEVLLARRATFEQERAALLPAIREADRHLAATRYGEAAAGQLHRGQIVGYDAAALGDVRLMLDQAERIVREAASRTHCGKQVVLVPNAVCQ